MARLCIDGFTIGRTSRLVGAALAAAVAASGLLPLTAAVADTAPAAASGLPETVSADALPTVQINGVVWSSVTVGNTVYATGDFTKARPAGSAVGVNETNRGGILAFDITTGNLITGFNHTLNGAGRIIVASPDGSRVYVGGDFTTVDGAAHAHLAAFDTASGTLATGFAPSLDGTVLGLTATNSTVYAGGSFTTVTTAAGSTARANIAALAAADGSVGAWNPQLGSGTVTALTMTPNQSAVVIGGRFTTINGAARYGLGSVSATDASLAPWNTAIPIQDAGNASSITTLTTAGNQILATGYVFGAGGNFEGAAGFDATGNINFLNSCHGDTYGAYDTNGVVYLASHEHDCSDINSWSETATRTWHRATAIMDHSVNCTAAHNDNSGYFDFFGQPCATQLDWYPDFSPGTYTGAAQGPWTVSGNANYVAYGGEFPSVNNVAQYGLTRFAVKTIAPNKQGPIATTALIPNALSIQPGTARVSWSATWDRDNENLTYNLYRSGTTLPVYTTTQASTFWNLPKLTYLDSAVKAGTAYKYRITVTDPMGNTVSVAQGPAVTISGAAGSAYSSDVLADGATDYWRLGEASGTAAYDWAGQDDLTLTAAVTQGAAGAINGDANTATTFDGATAFGATSTVRPGPNTFSEEVWFKTTTTAGGKIIGFGNKNTGNSSSYDRHIYMDTSGRVYFGVYNGASYTIATTAALNDGQWHQAVGTLSASGMAFYVDGRAVGTNAGTTIGQSFSGYWRVGGDSSWSGNAYFAGTIDEAAVYPSALTRAQVQKHFADSGRTLPPGTTAPADAYGQAVYADSPAAYYRMDDASGTTATDLSGNADNGVYTPTETFGVPSTVTGATGTAVTFDGANATLATSRSFVNPTTYSEELWFKTTTTKGGKLIGFGSSASGASGHYDRHVYMEKTGQLTFGAYPGTQVKLTSTRAYNDGSWHMLVASQGPGGMTLYVDGQSVAANTTTGQENYTGYWRIGSDSTWNGTYGFAGTIDEVAIYSTVLPAARVAAHFAASPLVNLAPVAAFTPTVANLAVSVDGSASSDSDGTVAGYAWTFGDGATANGVSAGHTYAAAGTYSIGLTVTDNSGAATTVIRSVTVAAANQPPVAAFTSAAADLTASVDASTSSDPDGTVAGYAWTFGDGATGTGATATHTYSSAGTYSIGLTVTDNSGATTALTRTVTVTAAAAGAVVASDDFGRTVTGGWGSADSGGAWTASTPSALSSDGNVGRIALASAGVTRTAYLNTVSSSDTDVHVSFALDQAATGGGTFLTLAGRKVAGQGDYRAKVQFVAGGSVRLQLVRSNSANTETALAAAVTVPGVTYTPGLVLQVRLQVVGVNPTVLAARVWNNSTAEPTTWQTTATDTTAGLQSAGGIGLIGYVSSSATSVPQVLTVDALRAVNSQGASANQSPIAAFTATPIGASVAFSAAGSSDPDGSIVSYAWAFGDGSTGTGVGVTHVYATPGTRSVTLTVTDNAGATRSTVSAVTTTPNQPPTALFSASTLGLTVALSGAGSTDPDGSIVGYAWTFGDGVSANGTTATHLYATAGTYTVTLTVTDDQGATGTSTSAIAISGPTVLASDDFARTTATGWGAGDQGGVWTVSAAAVFAVDGNAGRMTLKAAGSSPSAFMNTVSSTATDAQVGFAVDSAATGGGTYVSLVGRRITGAGDYRAKVQLVAGGTVRVGLTRTDTTGAETMIVALTTVAGLTYNPGDVLQVRLQANGVGTTALKAKVWAAGTTEPTAWTVAANDSTPALQTAGGIGLVGYLSGSSTKAPVVISFDALRVYLAGTM